MKQKPVHWPTTPQGKDHNYPITPYSSFSTQDMEGTQLFSELMNKSQLNSIQDGRRRRKATNPWAPVPLKSKGLKETLE